MLRLLIVIGFLWMFLPSLSAADTIILKNGKRIDSPQCWEDVDLVRCKMYGQTIGYPKKDIAEVTIETIPEKPSVGFRFGKWQSGITVLEAIDIAEAHNLPFHRSGLIISNKTFSAKQSRPYSDTETRFECKEQVFNKLATLRFEFAPTSKKLYSLEVLFRTTGIPKNSEFQQQLEATLWEKYGEPIQITDHIIYKEYDWRINNNAIVTMRPMSNSILVTYRDVTLANLAETEKLNRVRKGFTRSDKDKF